MPTAFIRVPLSGLVIPIRPSINRNLVVVVLQRAYSLYQHADRALTGIPVARFSMLGITKGGLKAYL